MVLHKLMKSLLVANFLFLPIPRQSEGFHHQLAAKIQQTQPLIFASLHLQTEGYLNICPVQTAWKEASLSCNQQLLNKNLWHHLKILSCGWNSCHPH